MVARLRVSFLPLVGFHTVIATPSLLIEGLERVEGHAKDFSFFTRWAVAYRLRSLIHMTLSSAYASRAATGRLLAALRVLDEALEPFSDDKSETL